MALIKSLRGQTPSIAPSAWLAENATVIGDVQVGEKSTVWYNVVLRGDVHQIRIGAETNVQDGAVIHGTFQKCGTDIGDRVTIGHLAMLHGCKIGAGTLVGMGAIIMDNCVVGEHCIVGAGSLLTENSEFPARSLIMGRPAKVHRPLTDKEIERLEQSADNYLMYREWYK